LCSASFVVVVVNSFTDFWIAALRRHGRFSLHGELLFSNAYKKSLRTLLLLLLFLFCALVYGISSHTGQSFGVRRCVSDVVTGEIDWSLIGALASSNGLLVFVSFFRRQFQ
jgi:hypothetical protein